MTDAAVAPRAKSVKHPVDEMLPAGKLAVYGFQHVLAFYAGAVIVPILLANSAASPRSSSRSASGRSGCGCRCCRA